MSTIIAGRFQQQSEVEKAVEELQHAGFPQEQISSFYVNPAGQHDTYPIGGDRALSPGAKETDKGAALGTAGGAAAGMAAVPVLGPAGPLVGAYVGALIGGLSQTTEEGDKGEANDVENAQPVRQSGMLVAVAVADGHHEDRAVDVLRSLGASDIEREEGTIENGDWVDFDPVAPPTLIGRGHEHRA